MRMQVAQAWERLEGKCPGLSLPQVAISHHAKLYMGDTTLQIERVQSSSTTRPVYGINCRIWSYAGEPLVYQHSGKLLAPTADLAYNGKHFIPATPPWRACVQAWPSSCLANASAAASTLCQASMMIWGHGSDGQVENTQESQPEKRPRRPRKERRCKSRSQEDEPGLEGRSCLAIWMDMMQTVKRGKRGYFHRLRCSQRPMTGILPIP